MIFYLSICLTITFIVASTFSGLPRRVVTRVMSVASRLATVVERGVVTRARRVARLVARRVAQRVTRESNKEVNNEGKKKGNRKGNKEGNKEDNKKGDMKPIRVMGS